MYFFLKFAPTRIYDTLIDQIYVYNFGFLNVDYAVIEWRFFTKCSQYVKSTALWIVEFHMSKLRHDSLKCGAFINHLIVGEKLLRVFDIKEVTWGLRHQKTKAPTDAKGVEAHKMLLYAVQVGLIKPRFIF